MFVNLKNSYILKSNCLLDDTECTDVHLYCTIMIFLGYNYFFRIKV